MTGVCSSELMINGRAVDTGSPGQSAIQSTMVTEVNGNVPDVEMPSVPEPNPLSALENVTSTSLLPLTETDETAEQAHEGYKAGESRKYAMRKQKHAKETDRTLTILILIGGAIVFITLALLLLLVVIIVRIRRKRAKQKPKEGPVATKQPRKMESEDLNRVKFQTAGPLVMNQKLRGPVGDGASIDQGTAELESVMKPNAAGTPAPSRPKTTRKPVTMASTQPRPAPVRKPPNPSKIRRNEV
ncbi:unnamed protein product [Haemonchus placei]|uniref:DAG1 domain-containing protein n=1 Tax=Haemonchus placei TaxID=6290 RepID=A0A0N4W1N7_HAEPC|nr:unnamed protein product [Haemonchus placei]